MTTGRAMLHSVAIWSRVCAEPNADLISVLSTRSSTGSFRASESSVGCTFSVFGFDCFIIGPIMDRFDNMSLNNKSARNILIAQPTKIDVAVDGFANTSVIGSTFPSAATVESLTSSITKHTSDSKTVYNTVKQ